MFGFNAWKCFAQHLCLVGVLKSRVFLKVPSKDLLFGKAFKRKKVIWLTQILYAF